jgi:hypothetical protein
LSVIAGTPSFNQRGKDMKRLLLTSASLLALLAAAPIASATTIPFSGAIVDFIVPADGTYQILAFGAQGGSSIDTQHNAVSPGGKGAEIGGDFILTKGEVLQIVVGGQGQSESASPNSGGGGGGSFVFDLRNKTLVVAGGGGAGGGFNYVARPGKAGYGGLTGGEGADGFGRVIHRGVGGSGGSGASGGGYGGGGGGFYGAGSDGTTASGGHGGGSGALGLNGGAGNSGGGNGGFGGGGGGGFNSSGNSYVGGGGGGFSGGGGGEGGFYFAYNYGGGGGGGGSFDGGTNRVLVPAFQTANGEVDITEVAGAPAVPEPSTWVTMATGFAALGLAGLRRRRKA